MVSVATWLMTKPSRATGRKEPCPFLTYCVESDPETKTSGARMDITCVEGRSEERPSSRTPHFPTTCARHWDGRAYRAVAMRKGGVSRHADPGPMQPASPGCRALGWQFVWPCAHVLVADEMDHGGM